MDFDVRMVRELKGAPLSIVLALGLAGGVAVSNEWLERNTGYSDKPVASALAYLQEHGFVVKVAGGWKLARAQQLPLPIEQVEEEAGGDDADPGADQAGDGYNSDTIGGSRNYSDSAINIKGQEVKETLEELNINSDSRKFSDCPEVGQALQDAGLAENWRTLKLLGRISVQDVSQAVQKMLDAGQSRKNTGYLLKILEGRAALNDRESRRQARNYQDWEQ